jgi:hypothetical protein
MRLVILMPTIATEIKQKAFEVHHEGWPAIKGYDQNKLVATLKTLFNGVRTTARDRRACNQSLAAGAHTCPSMPT